MTARHGRLRSTAAALCLFAAAALPAVPAGAGSVLLENVGIGGGAITMNVESFQEKKYKATLAQQYDFSCGSAALATLLTYNYNIPVSEQDVFKEMFDNGDKGPPCGVPFIHRTLNPPSITPALRNARISFSRRWSLIRLPICAISLS